MSEIMTIAGLLREYRSGTATPAAVVAEIFARIRAEGLAPVWISLVDEDAAIDAASRVDLSLPLAGIPFAVKDNINVGGMETTAGCPSFAHRAAHSAKVVSLLVKAGAVLIGKTNMDQFATGLVGTRTPYGACGSVYDDRYISGGSSSGSAVVVARGLCAFSLGTDTAGSGRVPAAFNNLVGLKPTRGLLSTSGVVPACRSLDCLSIFATTPRDAALVWDVARGFDAADPYSRVPGTGADAAPWSNGPFVFGVPQDSQLEFFGDEEAAQLFADAVARLEAAGGRRVTIDFEPFREAAALLYAGPWVAERYAAVGDFLACGPAGVDPVVGGIISGGATPSAADAFRAIYRLEALKQETAPYWNSIDVMFLPTTGTIYTKDQIAADPVRLNSNLGYYTNFVNLMDLAAIALPGGFRASGLPFGVSLIGRAWSDAGLLVLSERFVAGSVTGITSSSPSPGCVTVAVVGAHLTGQPLNHQLTERGARLLRTCRTSPDYRLFALPGTMPPKPGLVRSPEFIGAGIELELWSVPEDRFGGFVAMVPPPLAIGNVRLDSGEWVKGFVCEPAGLSGAEDISHFGGWRSYLASERVST